MTLPPYVPRVTVEIKFEDSAPAVRIEAFTHEEELRIRDWVETHPRLSELVARAHELADEARAA